MMNRIGREEKQMRDRIGTKEEQNKKRRGREEKEKIIRIDWKEEEKRNKIKRESKEEKREGRNIKMNNQWDSNIIQYFIDCNLYNLIYT